MIRILKVALNRRDWNPPRDATHVIEWVPPWQLDPAPADGCWSLDTIGNWLAGTPQPIATFDGPPAAADDLRWLVETEFGEQYDLTPFKVTLDTGASGPGPVTVPAYWVSPAEA